MVSIRSVISGGVREVRRGTERCGQIKTWPGNKGFKLHRANEYSVLWKTCNALVEVYDADFECSWDDIERAREGCMCL